MNCQVRRWQGKDRLAVTRRHFFRDCGVGVGKIALASMLAARRGWADEATGPMAVKPPHFAPRAKHVIYLFMAGAPSQLDLFDPKPALVKYDGQPVPASVVKDQRYAFIRPDSQLMSARYRFAKYGQSGAELSEIIPHLATVVDEIAIIKSVYTNQFNHAPAQIFVNTGSPLPGRPSMGSWVTYGLGSESEDLPGFVVLSSGAGISGGAANWSSGFLPTAYQGVVFRSQGDPILNVSNPAGVDARLQRESLDLIGELNRRHWAEVGDPEIETRIAAYEMAYRMQSSAPELMDLSGESDETLELYGVERGKPSFAANCLLARRLVERGVRFINLYHEGWDHHSDVKGGLKALCGQTDRASAALVLDLKRRGLLDETLVVWGGEFGRTPMVESNAALGRSMGRDHHPQAFTMWLAGGGIRLGITLGATDELGFHVVEDPVHVHDLQATILHLLGLDHTRLTYRFQGRDYRLTDVHGEVVRKLLA
ncbi:MAG: sulfatase [Isosphaeraceae bacterium]|nr:MAG: sulfatase [Isosphaeraceae bacterium]